MSEHDEEKKRLQNQIAELKKQYVRVVRECKDQRTRTNDLKRELRLSRGYSNESEINAHAMEARERRTKYATLYRRLNHAFQQDLTERNSILWRNERDVSISSLHQTFRIEMPAAYAGFFRELLADPKQVIDAVRMAEILETDRAQWEEFREYHKSNLKQWKEAVWIAEQRFTRMMRRLITPFVAVAAWFTLMATLIFFGL